MSRGSRKRRHRTVTGRVIAHRNEFNKVAFVLLVIGAFLLDTLNVLKNMIIDLVLIGLAVVIIALIFVLVKVKPYYDEYDSFATKAVSASDYDTFKLDEATYIYDNNGNLIVKLHGDQDSEYLDYKDIPKYAIDAFVAVEDRTFWDNPGIDIKGLIRVGVDFIQSKGEEMHGASTITQQLARNMFLTHEVSLERKGKEMLIAMKLAQRFTKQEIMEFYVNDICYANAYFGLEAAAKGYFNKPSSELSLSQIAYICSIPNSPEYYNPYKYPERALERRDKILNDMCELGYITKKEYNKAISEEITIEKPEHAFKNYQSTYAIDCATRYLMSLNNFEFKYSFEDSSEYTNYKKDYSEAYKIANNQLQTGGYTIYTSLDSDVQSSMQAILDNNLAFEEELDEETGIYKLQGAVTVVDNSTGKVIAVIGGRSQELDSQTYSLNRAYQSTRQPGSSIKPLVVYTPALMNGYTPNTTVYNIDVTAAKKKGVDVQSLTGTAMTLRSALEQSKNGVAWQTFDKLGAQYAMSFLTNMKFSSICTDDYYDSASLGGLTYGVTTVEMASAYSTLENHGDYRNPSCIVKMIDNKGNDIYREDYSKQIYSEYAADIMVDMMTGVLTKGTASKLKWYKSTDMIAACKTGTTNESKDGWLCGFTPYYTVTVWVGYDQPKTLSNLYGATYPGNIWKECMLSLIEDKEAITEFEVSESCAEYEQQQIEESMDEEFLPGRAADEVLSGGYTVADYRNDREIGKGVQAVINAMYVQDKSNASFAVTMKQLYDQGQAVINSVYSQKYKNELQTQLDWTYTTLLLEAGY